VVSEVGKEVLCGKIESHEAKSPEGYETDQINFSHRFAALENLTDSEDMSRAWENVKDSNKFSAEGTNFCMNGSSKNHDFMRNIHSFWIKRRRLKRSGYRVQIKVM